MDALKAVLTDVGIDCSSLSVLSAKTDRPIYRLSAAGGDNALATSRKLRSVSPTTGYWPVIVGAPERRRYHGFTDLPTDEQVRQTLASAESIAVPEWFTKRRQERLEEFLEYNEGEDPARFFAQMGEWPPDVRRSKSLYTPFDRIRSRAYSEVIFALIPTVTAWQAPAYLGFGGWNECPEPAIHCAAFRYWQERRGARIVVITNDVVEAEVEHPPTSRDDAIALAHEQYEYCDDIVSQGTQTISVLAASLLNAPFWFFWWD